MGLVRPQSSPGTVVAAVRQLAGLFVGGNARVGRDADVPADRAGPNLDTILLDAAERVAGGMEMADALEPWRDRFPSFFLPVLRCGDRSGRIDATLDYLKDHCHWLARPARVARNTWLVPLCIMLFGSAINIGAYLIFARFSAAVYYILGTAWFYAGIAAVVIAARHAPVLKTVVARLRLANPLMGATDRELAVNRFFHAMNVLYSTGGLRVEGMIRLAAESIDNVVLKADYLGAGRRHRIGRDDHRGIFGDPRAVARVPGDDRRRRRGRKTRRRFRHNLPRRGRGRDRSS